MKIFCKSALIIPGCSRQKKPKANELRALSKADLTKQLEDLKQQLASLRVQKVAGGSASKLTRMYIPLPSQGHLFRF